MSASEKLKALEAELQDAYSYTTGWNEERPILAALPQIRAVVEAAEKVDEHMWDDGTQLDPEVFGLRIASLGSALAALDEALQ